MLCAKIHSLDTPFSNAEIKSDCWGTRVSYKCKDFYLHTICLANRQGVETDVKKPVIENLAPSYSPHHPFPLSHSNPASTSSTNSQRSMGFESLHCCSMRFCSPKKSPLLLSTVKIYFTYIMVFTTIHKIPNKAV